MVASETLTENPILKQENLPKFESIQPSDLTPAISELLSKLEQVCIFHCDCNILYRSTRLSFTESCCLGL